MKRWNDLGDWQLYWLDKHADDGWSIVLTTFIAAIPVIALNATILIIAWSLLG